MKIRLITFRQDLCKKGVEGKYYISFNEKNCVYRVLDIECDGKGAQVRRQSYNFEGNREDNFGQIKSLEDCLWDVRVDQFQPSELKGN